MAQFTLMAFKAPWCMPCKVMEQTLENVLDGNKDIRFISINIDEDAEATREYRVRQIPTLLLIKNNNEIDRLVGNHSAERVKEFLSR